MWVTQDIYFISHHMKIYFSEFTILNNNEMKGVHFVMSGQELFIQSVELDKTDSDSVFLSLIRVQQVCVIEVIEVNEVIEVSNFSY